MKKSFLVFLLGVLLLGGALPLCAGPDPDNPLPATIEEFVRVWMQTHTGGGGNTNGGGGLSGLNPNGIVYGVTSTTASSTTSPTANGQYPCLYNVTASVAVPPTCPQLGLVSDQAANANVLYSDNGTVIYNPASALGLPNSASLGNPVFYTVSQENANAVVVTPASPYNIALNGAAAGTSQATATLPNHTRCYWLNDQIATAQMDIDCANVYGFFGGSAVPTSATIVGTTAGGALGATVLATNDVFLGVSNLPVATALADTSAGGLAETYNATTHTFGTISAGGAVSSVFTRTGAVVAQTGDYTCAQITNCANGVSATASTTSATASNPTINTDTKLIELSLSAGYLNTITQPYLIQGSGTYNTTVAAVPALTFKIKLCTVSGCGSGTVVTLANIVTGPVNTTANTGLSWSIQETAVTNATGSTGNLVVKGNGLTIDLGSTAGTADSVYTDLNTATSSNIDLTAALFVDFTVAQSVAGASNAYTQLLAMVAPTSGGGAGASLTGPTFSSPHTYWVPFYNFIPSATGTTVPIHANQPQIVSFNLTYPAKTSTVDVYIATGIAAATCDAGVYGPISSGNTTATLAWHSGSIACATSATYVNTAITPVTIQPGFYLLAVCGSSSSVTFGANSSDGGWTNILSNNLAGADATDTCTSGVLPSTITLANISTTSVQSAPSVVAIN